MRVARARCVIERTRASSCLNSRRTKQNFSATLLQELRSFGNGDLIAVAPLVRGYVQSLGRIQKAVRIAVAPDVSHWDGELLTVLEQAQTAFGTTSAVVVGFQF